MLLLTLATGLSSAGQAQDKKGESWAIATDTIKPWVYFDDSGARGIVYDILNTMAQGMGHTITLRPVPLRRTYTELLSGNAELSIIIIDDKTLHYPEDLTVGDKPIFSFSVVAVSLKSKEISINSLAQLKALRVGNIRLPPQVDTYIRENSAHTAYNDPSSLLKGLLSDRIDVATTAMPVLFDAAKSLGVSRKLEVVYTLDQASMYLALSNKALGKKVKLDIKQANQEIRNMKEDGRLAEIISKYSDLSYFSNYK